MRQYTSSEWPRPSYICLYTALGEQCLDTPGLVAHNLLSLLFFSLQRFPTDRAYFIAKELLTTERTYVKDLEVVTVVRKQKVCSPACCSTVSFLLRCPLGRKHWLFRSAAPLHKARQNTESGSDIGIFWHIQLDFLFSPHTRALKCIYWSNSRLWILICVWV